MAGEVRHPPGRAPRREVGGRGDGDKEWAYAGFAINLVSAAYSHAAAGDPAQGIVAPVALLGLLLASWRLRPADRRLADAPAAQPVGRLAPAAA